MATSRNVKGRLLQWQISYDKRVAKLKGDKAKLLYTWIIPSLDNLGRMEGEPRIVRSMIFPYVKITDKQVGVLLQDIHNKGLLFWYSVNGEKYLQCPTTQRNIYFKTGGDRNRISDYPEPPKKEYEKWVVQTRTDKSGRCDMDLDLDLDLDYSSSMSNLKERWNKKMPWKIRSLDDTRKKHLRARIEEPDFRDNFDLIMEKILANDFLSGKKPSQKYPNYKADFDWIIKNNSHYTKILEGKYDSLSGTELEDDYEKAKAGAR